MILGHVGGMPVEEWLTPLLLTAGGTVFALRAALRRFGASIARRTDRH